MKMQLVVLFLCTVFASGNAAYGGQQSIEGASEIWGGRGVTLRMTAQGATSELQFDCAHGNVAQAIKPDAKGEFSVSGTYTAERGGPVRKSDSASGVPAIYQGRISGDTMQLVIKLSDKETLPALTLTRGAVGRLVKCR